MTAAQWELATEDGGYFPTPQNMNNTWLDTISGLGDTAANLVGAFKSNSTAKQVTAAQQSTNAAWMPIVLIGAVVLLVLGIVIFRKS